MIEDINDRLGLTSSNAYIPSDIVCILRWQLKPAQVNCTCNANGFHYILYGLLIKMKMMGLCVMIMQMLFRNLIFLFMKFTQRKMYYINAPTRPKKTLSEI